jgi:hypothetical protein
VRSWSKSPAARQIAIGGAVVIAAASVFNLLTGPDAIKRSDTYDQIFLESHSAQWCGFICCIPRAFGVTPPRFRELGSRCVAS